MTQRKVELAVLGSLLEAQSPPGSLELQQGETKAQHTKPMSALRRLVKERADYAVMVTQFVLAFGHRAVFALSAGCSPKSIIQHLALAKQKKLLQWAQKMLCTCALAKGCSERQ
ncbi:hypothetical protein DSO57_1005508 [Entomophthora muscae]|uniref:Uncharacterized protein n=1 Tax=Entomophthora muscae TaxID=34485 RepID=A0ACC2SXL6_9FUNG|nr:hypothetical protein DSO57_1005508 [Entomophthora muscae]